MIYRQTKRAAATLTLLLVVLVITLALTAFRLNPIESAKAASTPSLGAAGTYAVLANTYTNTTAGTTINGDIGFTTAPAVVPAGTHTNYGSGAPYSTAGTDQGTALVNLNAQSCTFSFPTGAVNLATDTTHGTAGIYTPGVYCGDAAMDIGGPLTLNGSGTYIFRSVGALTSAAGAIVTLTGGASVCNVFWTPAQAATLATGMTFRGTVISNSGITIGSGTNWTGRALAYAGTVTTDTATVTASGCTGTINVVKTVINNSGGTKVAGDFPLFVGSTPVVSGATNSFTAPGSYTISETVDPNYTQAFSGDCSASGVISLNPGDVLFCVITNDDIGNLVTSPAPTLVNSAAIATQGAIKLPKTGVAPKNEGK